MALHLKILDLALKITFLFYNYNVSMVTVYPRLGEPFPAPDVSL